MRVELIMGDWSNDGHGRTESVYFESNLSAEEMAKAFTEGLKKAGVEPDRDFAAYMPFGQNYGDCVLPHKLAAKLEAAGIELFKGDEWKGKGYGYGDREGFAQLWVDIAKLGNPALECKQVPKGAYLFIGGYGLFD